MAKRPPARRPAKPKTTAKRKPAAKAKTTAKRKTAAKKRAPARSRLDIPPPPPPRAAAPPAPAPASPPTAPKRSLFSRWWPIVAVVLMFAAVAVVAIVRFTGSDGSEPADHGFAADFPTEPEHTTSSFRFGDATTTTDIFMSQDGDDGIGVGVTPLPSGVDPDIENVLDTAARTSVAALGYKITGRKPFTVGGDEALDITATGDQVVYRSRFIHHDGKLYQLIGIGTSGHVPTGYAAFARSFRFT